MMSRAKFIAQFFKEPTTVGALSPSSRALGQLLADEAQVDQASFVVEFGTGTGVISDDQGTNTAMVIAVGDFAFVDHMNVLMFR